MQKLVEWNLRTFNLSFISTKSNHPEMFFLKSISAFKVSLPEDDA